MKSLADLEQFYYSTLLPELTDLEEERKKIRKKSTKIFGTTFLVALVVGVIFKSLLPSILTGVIGVVVYFVVCGPDNKKLYHQFKIRIIGKIVSFIDPHLKYDYKSYIPQQVFKRSGIFQKGIDRYSGDDYVSGTLEKTHIEFSELDVEYITRDSEGNEQRHTIFKGIFFSADFNKHFKTKTYVLPDVAEQLFGFFGETLQSLFKSHGELVKMEDPEFEKQFVVYGKDQIEARYILSPALIRRILDFKTKTKHNIYLSFVDTRVYIALSFNRNLFEPRLFSSYVNFESIQQYYEDLRLALDLVEELNLNNRIWTKS
jgi:hypothetical protein